VCVEKNRAPMRTALFVPLAIASVLDMSILSEDDLDIYFPSGLVDIAKLPDLIAYLSGIAQGDLGAQRPLEKQSHVEQKTLHLSQREYFVDGWPIDQNQPIAVELRAINQRNRYRRPIPDSAWGVLPATQYEIGLKSIRFINPETDLVQGFNRKGGSAAGQLQVRLSYTGGFDFQAQDLAVGAIEIKYTLGQLLEYFALNMNPASMRIQSEEVFQESKTSYAVSAGQGTSPGTTAIGGFPEYLLVPFHKYRPYQYRF
jgi:hypothetical protein